MGIARASRREHDPLMTATVYSCVAMGTVFPSVARSLEFSRETGNITFDKETTLLVFEDKDRVLVLINAGNCDILSGKPDMPLP